METSEEHLAWWHRKVASSISESLSRDKRPQSDASHYADMALSSITSSQLRNNICNVWDINLKRDVLKKLDEINEEITKCLSKIPRIQTKLKR